MMMETEGPGGESQNTLFPMADTPLLTMREEGVVMGRWVEGRNAPTIPNREPINRVRGVIVDLCFTSGLEAISPSQHLT